MKRDIPHFRIGLLLTEAGILAPRQLDDAIKEGEEAGTPFLRVLVTTGYLKQHELQAVIRAQSLIWSGLLDVDRAIKALHIVHNDNVSIDEGLLSVGWVRPENSMSETICSVVKVQQMDSYSGEGAESNGARSCQYCGTALLPNTTLCSFCTGENAKQTTSARLRLEPAWQRESALIEDGTRITASMPARDPILMGCFSTFGFAGVGQILIGQSAKGACLLVLCALLAFITGGASSLFLLPIAGLDAYLLADKLRNGKSIGPWEFF